MEKIMFCLVFCLLFACNKDVQQKTDFENLSTEESPFNRRTVAEPIPNSVQLGSHVFYFSGIDSVVYELFDGILKSQYLLPKENVEIKFVNEFNDDFTIQHKITNEEILITNIVEQKNGSFIYDASWGDKNIKGFTYFPENTNGLSHREIWVRAIIAVATSFVKLLEDTPLEQCKAAMLALKCKNGTNPYMDFSEGWFKNTCKVGCR